MGHLLAWLPRTWELPPVPRSLASLAASGKETEGEESTAAPGLFRGTIQRVRAERYGGRSVVGAELVDVEGRALPLVWFQSPWMASSLEGRTGETAVVGVPRRDRHGRWQLVQPRLEDRDADVVETLGPRPIYPAVEGVGARLLEGWIGATLDGIAHVPDWLPEEVRRRLDLPDLDEALRFLHRPPSGSDAEALRNGTTRAHRRLVFGELLESQLAFAERRRRRRASPKPHRIEIDEALRRGLRSILPFRLTGSQRRALTEIVDDLRAESPMHRLLQGDVGCGKTVVAGLAAFVALENRLQVAVMAPTGVLAEQLRRNLAGLLGDRHRVELLLGDRGSGRAAARVRQDLRSGELGCVVGTHALFADSTEFRRLGLVIVDEQHRFGVEQRRALVEKGARPDVLVMTATPIPRSLALAVWGDLDSTVIDELPPGRRPVETRLVPASERARVDAELLRRVESGERIFVVVPAIEERSDGEVASVEEVAARLSRRLDPGLLRVLHSGIPDAERSRILEDFAAGECRVLVATTVIEVGVDVPSATLMVVEGAERFGLAQLHQLRGRVGRGSRASTCLAVHGAMAEVAHRRLEAFASTQDGFRLAELDLTLRGPGEALGTRQAGAVRYRLADPVRDVDLLEKAREEARRWAERRSAPGRLRRRVERRLERVAALGAG